MTGEEKLYSLTWQKTEKKEKLPLSHSFVRTPNHTAGGDAHPAEHLIQAMPFDAISTLPRSEGRDIQSTAWGGH